MHHPAEQSPLGKTSAYVSQYAPQLLFAIPRLAKWTELGVMPEQLPWQGVDYWNCYELSWLTPSGKPQVACAEFALPADSPQIIESKSFKLYLGSLNQSVFASWQEVERTLTEDLSRCAQAQVTVRLLTLEQMAAQGVSQLSGQCIDECAISVTDYSHPRPQLLRCDPARLVSEQLYSHLLKSNCPVTGQPDWGSVWVDYQGPQIDPASLLEYLVSFRQHQDFHEQCVERIFLDLKRYCQPSKLTVYARYVRRGGLDINPWRSTEAAPAHNVRLARQ